MKKLRIITAKLVNSPAKSTGMVILVGIAASETISVAAKAAMQGIHKTKLFPLAIITKMLIGEATQPCIKNEKASQTK